jgi:hypothetical protein
MLANNTLVHKAPVAHEGCCPAASDRTGGAVARWKSAPRGTCGLKTMAPRLSHLAVPISARFDAAVQANLPRTRAKELCNLGTLRVAQPPLIQASLDDNVGFAEASLLTVPSAKGIESPPGSR